MPDISEMLGYAGPAGLVRYSQEQEYENAGVSVKTPTKTDTERYAELLAAVQGLLDAPHYDHWEARLSDGELEAMNKLKTLVRAQPEAPGRPQRLVYVPEGGGCMANAPAYWVASGEAADGTTCTASGKGNGDALKGLEQAIEKHNREAQPLAAMAVS